MSLTSSRGSRTVPLGLAAGLVPVALWSLAPGPVSQAGPELEAFGAIYCDTAVSVPGDPDTAVGCPSAAHSHGPAMGPDLFGKRGAPGTRNGTGAAPGAGHSSTCPAGNARDNVYSPPYEVGIDFVPLTTDDTLGFHVVYSGKDNGSMSGTSLNSNIYLFEQLNGGLLIFGGGYGDPAGPYTALNDADFDVANVDLVVRQCLGKTPADTPIDFLWPHWHGDHGNDEFIHSLEDAGYSVRSIVFHEDDASYVYGFGWNQADLAKMVELPDGACNTPIASTQTTVGPVWVTARSGHTAGAVDLVIDVRGNVNDRFHIRGSAQGTPCPNPPDGTTDQIESHNNVILTNLPQVVPYGCVNTFGSLTHVSGTPKPNQLQTFDVDDPSGSVAPGALSYLLASTRPDPGIPCGTVIDSAALTGPSELLLDPFDALTLSPPIAGGIWSGPGSPAQVSARIPGDPSLQGTSLYAQAFLLNPAGGYKRRLFLTDALELRVR